MTSQTPEECRHCKVAEAQGVTHIHPEVDTTEIEEVVYSLFIEHIEDLMNEAEMAVRYEVKDKEQYYERLRTGSRSLIDVIRTTLLSQQQKHQQHEQDMYESLDANYQLMLQKAREDMLHTLDSSIDNVTYAPKKPSDYKAWQDGFMEAYQQARKLIKRSELDTTSPVYKFFTASEEVRRPAIEEALKKASQEQSELDQDKK